MNKDLLSLLKKKKQMAYNNPSSILQKYDAFLETHGIYRSFNRNLFNKSIEKHSELCDGVLTLYAKAQLENERLMLLEDLLVMGYDENKLVELILNVFDVGNYPSNLWEYADLLYSIKNYNYLLQYIQIIKEEEFGEARQMLILLVGESKQTELIPVLIELLRDSMVTGHALEALSNFDAEIITQTMHKYSTYPVKWIRAIAKKYLSKTD